MKVRALKSFVHRNEDGTLIVASGDQVLEMPEGADWLRAGLVVEVPTPDPSLKGGEIELEVVKPPERAVSKRGKKKG